MTPADLVQLKAAIRFSCTSRQQKSQNDAISCLRMHENRSLP